MKIKFYFSKNKIIIGSLLFLIIYSVALVTFATPPGSPYSAGETLDPGCIPGSSNCTVTVGATPAGSNTDIQYNDGGVFGGDSNFTWNKTTQEFNVTSPTTAFLNFNGTSGSTGFNVSTLTVSSVTGSGGDRFLIDGNSDIIELGDISGGANGSLITQNDALQITTIETGESGIQMDGTTGLSFIGTNQGFSGSNRTGFESNFTNQTLKGIVRGTNYLSVNGSTKIATLGDSIGTFDGTHLSLDFGNGVAYVTSGVLSDAKITLDDTTNSITLSTLGNSYLNIDGANASFSIGDLGNFGNGNKLIIDDLGDKFNFSNSNNTSEIWLNSGFFATQDLTHNVLRLGNDAGLNIGTGPSNTFLGISSGRSATTADRATFVGFESGYTYNISTSAAAPVVFVGYRAGKLYQGVSGHGGDVYIGDQAGLNVSTGYESVYIGHAAGSSVTTGVQNVTIGYGTLQSGSTTAQSRNVILGFDSGRNSTGSDNTLIGWAAGYTGLVTGSGNIMIGSASGGGTNNANTNILIGNSTNANGIDNTIGIGNAVTPTAANQFVVGSSTTAYTDVYFGSGVIGASPATFTLNASGGSGTNIAGANISIASGKATGNAAGGSILFQTSNAGGSGTTLQSLSTKAILLPSGNFGIGTTNPLSLLSVKQGSSGYLDIDPANHLYRIGDIDGTYNSTYLHIDDATKKITLQSSDAQFVMDEQNSNLFYQQGGNHFLSLDSMNKLYGVGDLDNSGGKTKLLIDDNNLIIDAEISSSSGAVFSVANSDGTCTLDPGDVSGWSCPSDVNLKKDITDLGSVVASIMQLRPVTYRLKNEDENVMLSTGLIAQEVQPIFPKLVNAQLDGTLSLNYGGLTPILIKAVQEINLKFEPLTSLNLNETDSLGNLIKQYLEDAGNNIQTFFANKVQTHELCLDEVCVTKDQLQTLLNQQNPTTSTSGTTGGDTSSTGDSTSTTGDGGTGDTPSDTTPPIITLIGDSSISLSVGDTYEEQGATAIDDTDGDITANIQTTNNIDTNTPGTYTVRYSIVDSAANMTEITREVVVTEI